MRSFAVMLGLLCGSLGVLAAVPPPVDVTALKAQRAEALSENQLIGQVQDAQAAKDWPKAEALLLKLTAMDPGQWQYRQALADVRFDQGKYADALDDYSAALVAAEKAKLSPTIRQAMALMYTHEGNAYIKLKRNDDAVKAFTQAAGLSDKPGTAWFDVCAVEYNQGMMDPALVACDKALAADPKLADAYFIKGSILVGNSSVDAAGKTVAPAGAVEALQMYLKLAPTGGHAADVQQMLDFLNGKN